MEEGKKLKTEFDNLSVGWAQEYTNLTKDIETQEQKLSAL
jgi:hypothetical protein